MLRLGQRFVCIVGLAILAHSGQAEPVKVRPNSAPVLATPVGAEVQPALLRYQLALDRLAAGDFASARALAEEARKRYGDAPEINLLLAYLLQHQGRNAAAQAALDAVKDSSPLAAQFALQLNGETGDMIVPLATENATQTAAQTAAQNAAQNATRLSLSVSLPQSDAQLAALEKLLMQRVNGERAKAGLESLVWDGALASVSRAHSAEMRDKKYFAHESPVAALKNPIDRYRAAFGKTPHVVAENVYRSWGSPRKLGEAEIEAAHEALMKSPGHRANILYADVRRIGIGIVVNANGDLWVTQMFART